MATIMLVWRTTTNYEAESFLRTVLWDRINNGNIRGLRASFLVHSDCADLTNNEARCTINMVD